jgi:tetratricopeptide (TPR) repeat protein
VVAQLRAAADVAMRRGAPDAALTLLERAQAEPPAPEEQAALALELGGSAAYLRGPAGVEPLERAYAELTDPVERGRAAIRLGHLLLFVRSPQEGVALAQQAADALPPGSEDLRQGLLAVRLIGVAFGALDPAEFATLEAVRRGPRGDGPGARALTAMTALATALVGGPAAEASALAREAFAGGGLERLELTASVALATAVLTLGDLPRAIESLDRAHEGERLWGTKLDAVMAYSAAFLSQAWLECGHAARARDMLDRLDASDGTSDGARFWQAAHAELLLAEGEPAAALEITVRLEPMRPLDTHPVWAPWRGLRARALAALGREEEALALAAAEADVARRVGAPWVAGRALRMLAGLEGAAGRDHAREAVELLEGGSARLELAKARALADRLA